MHFGIIAVESRKEYVIKLREEIGLNKEQFQMVYYDYKLKGHWWNLRRAIQDMIWSVPENDLFLICCDDAKPCKDWEIKFNEFKTETFAYVLFTRKKNVLTDNNIKQGYYNGLVNSGFYDVGVVFRNNRALLTDMILWIDKQVISGDIIPKKYLKHFDFCIQYYLNHHKIKVTISTPSLFNTRDIPSVIKHNCENAALLSYADREP
jgi:hypothetical protein